MHSKHFIYGYMPKDQSFSERGNLLPPLCGALARMRNSSAIHEHMLLLGFLRATRSTFAVTILSALLLQIYDFGNDFHLAI